MSQNLQLSIAVHLLAGLMSRNDRRETDRQEDIGHSLDVAALLIRESGRRSSPGGHQTPEPRRAVRRRDRSRGRVHRRCSRAPRSRASVARR